MTSAATHECYTDDWQRTKPDLVVYLPKTPRGLDGYADHFLVDYTPSGDLLAMWTMSGVEGSTNTRVVCSRSEDDGQTWTRPEMIAGATKDNWQVACFAIPIMSRAGRIYCYYNKEIGIVDSGFRGSTMIGCHYSDDDGRTWIDSGLTIGYGRIENDHPDPKVPCNCIMWQKPIRDAKDRLILSLTHSSSREKFPESAPNAWGVTYGDSQGQLARFENIDQGPDPQDVRITWLPPENVLRYPINPVVEPEHSRGYCLFHEPSVALLPDGRLFAAASSVSGHLIHSVSEDPDGVKWRKPETLRYMDDGKPLLHPIAPAPLFGLADGRFLIFYHGHDGTKHGGLGPRHMRGRRPTCMSVGVYKPDAHQPIWFSQPIVLCDTHGVGAGPEGLVWLANYASLTERDGKRIFWYVDRKHFLLARHITDQMLDAATWTVAP